MYKFTTIKCSGCGAVIYNLPEIEAKKLKSIKLQCDDCNDNKFFKDFSAAIVGCSSSEPIRCSA